MVGEEAKNTPPDELEKCTREHNIRCEGCVDVVISQVREQHNVVAEPEARSLVKVPVECAPLVPDGDALCRVSKSHE